MRPAVASALCLLVLALVGCGGPDAPDEQPENAMTPVSDTASGGGLTLTVTADRDGVRVAEPVRVTVELQGPQGAETQLPDLAGAVEDFLVQDHSPIETERAEDGTQVQRQSFVLDSNVSGPRVVPSLTVVTDEGEVTTAPLSIEVASGIEGEYDPAEYADIVGPVSIPKPRNWAFLWWAAGLVSAVVALAWWLLRGRKARAAQVAPPPPPHVWALQQLEALLAEKLVERGRVPEFYFRLSGLVRTYIELRFGLMAPERTTEEFLVEVQRSDALRFGPKDMLGDFLTACDLVKFARHEPRGVEIDTVVDASRTFIEQTAPLAARGVAA